MVLGRFEAPRAAQTGPPNRDSLVTWGEVRIAARLIADTLGPRCVDLSEAPAKLAALDQQPGNGITIISRTPLAP